MIKYNSRHCVIQTRWFDLPMFGVAEAALVAALDAFSDKDGWCWPSQGTLATMLKKSRPWVIETMKALVGMGIIEKQSRKSPDGNTITCMYRVLHDSFRECQQDDTPCQPTDHPCQPTDTNKTIEHITSNEVIKTKKASRLPSNWEPDDELLGWARREFPTVNTATATDSFRDYWTALAGARGVKADWRATWRNWIRNQVNYGKRPGPSTQNRAPAAIDARDNLERLAEAAAEYRRTNVTH